MRTLALDPGLGLPGPIWTRPVLDSVRRDPPPRDFPALIASAPPKLDPQEQPVRGRSPSRGVAAYHYCATRAAFAKVIRTHRSFFGGNQLSQTPENNLPRTAACCGYLRVEPGDAVVDFLAGSQPNRPQALNRPSVRRLRRIVPQPTSLGLPSVFEPSTPHTSFPTRCWGRGR